MERGFRRLDPYLGTARYLAVPVQTPQSRQDVEPLNEEQRRELIATIWREIYGPSRRGS
jgi:hypothetical protein